MKKFLLFCVMVVSLSFMSIVNVSADIDYDEVEAQHELLLDLLFGRAVIPQAFSDDDFEIPVVNIIIPIWEHSGDPLHFLIGVESEPTQACIDFILAFTGIPAQYAYIGLGRFEREVLVTYVGDLPCEEIYQYVDNYVGIMPLSTLNMGQMVSTRSPVNPNYIQSVTVGHPINSSAFAFATTFHMGSQINGSLVYIGHRALLQRLGIVTRSYFTTQRDVSIVSIMGGVFNQISPFVDGGMITDFRASASILDPVISIRGLSGVQRSTVFTVNATGPSFSNKIGIYPNGNSQRGDSGAALIRRLDDSDRAVLGTRSGTASIGTRVLGLYTLVTSY